jgi:hypothetical protein
VDETRLRDHASDGAHALADDAIGDFKCLRDSFLGQNEFAHAIVFKGDERVGVTTQFFKRGGGLAGAAFAFKNKRHGGKNHDECPGFASEARDERSSARAGAAAKADAEEHHLASGESVADFLRTAEGGFESEFGIAAAAEALG